jgi:hypothetical protein
MTKRSLLTAAKIGVMILLAQGVAAKVAPTWIPWKVSP